MDPSAARTLMDRFAAATGLTSDASPRRYLWTDAFAVCNWLGLDEAERAVELVDRVHRTLGRHRPDDPRTGWISGLAEEEAREHPTAGGLRIGKPLPERGPDEPYHPQLEWERDGQYFHYLTRWMRALERVAEATGEDRYHRWAGELAQVAFEGFSHGIGPVPNRLYWKMSIDLSRPQVPSMGQHDPLDGYVVMSEIRAAGEPVKLQHAIDALIGMAKGSDWTTEDPLGAGALLTDAWILARLPPTNDEARPGVLRRLIHAGALSLRDIRDTRFLELSPSRRLPFRELGLAIGLAGAARLDQAARSGRLPPETAGDLPEILGSAALAEEITGFWRDPEHQASATWTEHEDINTVMLATALAPDGYLG